jgi:hypothetical protein
MYDGSVGNSSGEASASPNPQLIFARLMASKQKA